MTRAEDGAIHAFSNVCRHRAGPVARGSGHRKALMCGYHGWTYGLDGKAAEHARVGRRALLREGEAEPPGRAGRHVGAVPVRLPRPVRAAALDGARLDPGRDEPPAADPHEPLQEGRLRGPLQLEGLRRQLPRGVPHPHRPPRVSSRSSTTARTRSRPPHTTPSSTRRSGRRTRSPSTGAISPTGTSRRLSTTGSSRT